MALLLTERAKRYIEDHLHAIQDAADVACALGTQPERLIREFRLNEGETIGRYIYRCRIVSMRLDLRTTSLSEEEIARRAGFESQEEAQKMFQISIRCSMATYRKHYRQRNG